MDHGVSFRQKQRQSRTNTASIKAKHKLQYLLQKSIITIKTTKTANATHKRNPTIAIVAFSARKQLLFP
jgi:hypothetical protein